MQMAEFPVEPMLSKTVGARPPPRAPQAPTASAVAERGRHGQQPYVGTFGRARSCWRRASLDAARRWSRLPPCCPCRSVAAQSWDVAAHTSLSRPWPLPLHGLGRFSSRVQNIHIVPAKMRKEAEEMHVKFAVKEGDHLTLFNSRRRRRGACAHPCDCGWVLNCSPTQRPCGERPA